MLYFCRLKQLTILKIWLWVAVLVLLGILVTALSAFHQALWIGLILGGVVAALFSNTLFLPPRLEVYEDCVKLKEFRFFGLSVDEQSVAYSKIALVKKGEGLFFSTIIIETSGGDRDLRFAELKRGDARKAYEFLEKHRKGSPASQD